VFLDYPRVPTTVEEIRLSSGRAGVIETLGIMRKLVRHYKRDPHIMEVARAVVAMLPAKNWRAENAAMLDFVRNEIRYTADVNGVETLYTPDKLLDVRQGDCDDMATLLATLLESIGHPTRFKAVGFAPDELSHVYVQVRDGTEWVSLDATENERVGWEPEDIVSVFYVHN